MLTWSPKYILHTRQWTGNSTSIPLLAKGPPRRVPSRVPGCPIPESPQVSGDSPYDAPCTRRQGRVCNPRSVAVRTRSRRRPHSRQSQRHPAGVLGVSPDDSPCTGLLGRVRKTALRGGSYALAEAVTQSPDSAPPCKGLVAFPRTEIHPSLRPGHAGPRPPVGARGVGEAGLGWGLLPPCSGQPSGCVLPPGRLLTPGYG